MKQKIVVRYSEAFKMQVIKDIESGRFNIHSAGQHYGVKGTLTIKIWLKKYGRNHLCPKVVRVEKPNERNQMKQLKNEIKELQMALGVTQTEKVLENSFLKIACRKLGIDVEDFKKKADLQRFMMQQKIQVKP